MLSKIFTFALLALQLFANSNAAPGSQTYGPQMVLSTWKKSTGTGYNGIKADILSVSYTNATKATATVYVTANMIPSYSIGPTWKNNPNIPAAQNKTFQFPMYPSYSSTSYNVNAGSAGLWIDGVALYKASMASSFNGWQYNAYFADPGFDACYGHADVALIYHNHVNPTCLEGNSQTSMTQHSPIVGYLFDGFPIYGPFGFSTANTSSSGVRRMVSGYNLRTDYVNNQRTSLCPTCTALNESAYGPNINTNFPLGMMWNDYVWTSGGDLDSRNGRWCVTPEYPTGTYAYFTSTNSDGTLAFPYSVGPTYFGKPGSTFATTVPTGATLYY